MTHFSFYNTKGKIFTQSAVSYSECIQGIYSRYFPVIWNINKPDKINLETRSQCNYMSTLSVIFRPITWYVNIWFQFLIWFIWNGFRKSYGYNKRLTSLTQPYCLDLFQARTWTKQVVIFYIFNELMWEMIVHCFPYCWNYWSPLINFHFIIV